VVGRWCACGPVQEARRPPPGARGARGPGQPHRADPIPQAQGLLLDRFATGQEGVVRVLVVTTTRHPAVFSIARLGQGGFKIAVGPGSAGKGRGMERGPWWEGDASPEGGGGGALGGRVVPPPTRGQRGAPGEHPPRSPPFVLLCKRGQEVLLERCQTDDDDLSVAILDGTGRAVSVAIAEITQLVLHDVPRSASQ
jgi:hypothetical protein